MLPDGRVPICQFNTRSVGNLREKSFEEIWFGEEGTRGRQWVKDCPGCWAECEVLPSAVYTGDLLVKSLGSQKPVPETLPEAAAARAAAKRPERLPII